MRNRRFAVALLLTVVVAASCSPRSPATSTPASVAPGNPVVTLTFDDGDADNYPVGALLQKNGLHATFYIPSGLVGQPGFMTWDQIKDLAAAGNEIGGHSLAHVKLQGLDTTNLKEEICDDRQDFVNRDFTPVSFAYPFGNYDPNVVAMVKQCGYDGARTVQGGPDTIPPADRYLVRAFPYVVSDTDMGKLQRYVSGTRKEGGGWVILIFHHVCDSCDYFAVHPDILNKFIPWLASQQAMGHLTVKTFAEVIEQR